MSQKSFDKLVKLMTRLRAKNGCPWDRAQTHSSLKKYLIEEAYEVCDVIDSRDSEKLKDELGDLLFQSIFHAQLAKERGAFDIDDVLKGTLSKMLRRHPHVFGKHKAKGPEEAYKRWEEKKHKENQNKGEKGLLRGVPKHLPALLKAQKVSKRAAMLGFAWPGINGAVKKVDEELREIKKELKYSSGGRKNKLRIAEEIGDTLFAIACLARFADIDAEEALNKTTKKFAKRFQRMEEHLEKQGKKINECSLEELIALFKKYHTKTHYK